MQYLLQYYDQLVLDTMQPDNVISIEPHQAEKLAATALQEKRKITTNIISFMLSLKKEQTARLHLTTYHASMRCLQRTCIQYSEHPVYNRNSSLKNLIGCVIDSIDYLSSFLEQRFQPYIIHRDNNFEPCSMDTKIQTSLSIDQLAILFRACFEESILRSRSLRSLFLSLAPLLSTRERQELSGNSMRSKSYHPETRDKHIIIDTLQTLIEKIDQY
ncbi:hypothetical protein ABDK00_009545 [Niabella insulamsoli]|uniref:hypothetical protein n=1 Tax=Niabella insulamsoli TaxID=3144874 RepID=UPI0031FBAEC5